MTTVTDYETDFYQWTQQQAALLRQGRLSRIDAANLAEEIESMGNSNRWALESFLSNVIMHLLKWKYQPERRCASWKMTIRNGRIQIEKRLKNSPSLRPKLPEMIAGEYLPAREDAADETGLPLTTFPEQCEFSVEEITGDYWP
jgi:hypothetical protein